MMGQQGGGQDRLFYSFNLEAHVPQDHLLRSIDRHLDLSDLRRRLEAYYSQTGRPSIDPELMIRMLILGYSPVGVSLRTPTLAWPEWMLGFATHVSPHLPLASGSFPVGCHV